MKIYQREAIFPRNMTRGTFGSTVALSFKRPITKREFEKWLWITPSSDKPATPLFTFLNFVRQSHCFRYMYLVYYDVYAETELSLFPTSHNQNN
jgi:hypothetical protein